MWVQIIFISLYCMLWDELMKVAKSLVAVHSCRVPLSNDSGWRMRWWFQSDFVAWFYCLPMSSWADWQHRLSLKTFFFLWKSIGVAMVSIHSSLLALTLLRFNTSQIWNSLQAIVINSVLLPWGRYIHKWNIIESPEISPYVYN